MNDILDIPTNTAAQAKAEFLLGGQLPELQRRIDHHHSCFSAFWDDPNATPAQIAAEMGDRAAQFLTLAQASVEDIAGLISKGATGKTLLDYMPSAWWKPRLPLTANPDGTVTVGTVEGLDSWGRPIQQTETTE